MTFQSLPFFFSARLYAEDTSLKASESDLDSLLCEINNHLPAVNEWLCSNKLMLNFSNKLMLNYYFKVSNFHASPKDSYINLYPPLTVAKCSFREVLLCEIILVCILIVAFILGMTISIITIIMWRN